jgi:hypothetical protein
MKYKPCELLNKIDMATFTSANQPTLDATVSSTEVNDATTLVTWEATQMPAWLVAKEFANDK